jgi:hypothetical protein
MSVKTGRLVYDFGKKRPAQLMLQGSFEATSDMVDVVRKPGTGGNVNNEEERRKVGEISVKSNKLDASISFEYRNCNQRSIVGKRKRVFLYRRCDETTL